MLKRSFDAEKPKNSILFRVSHPKRLGLNCKNIFSIIDGPRLIKMPFQSNQKIVGWMQNALSTIS